MPKPSAVTIRYYRPTQASRTVSSPFASGPKSTSIGATLPKQSGAQRSAACLESSPQRTPEEDRCWVRSSHCAASFEGSLGSRRYFDGSWRVGSSANGRRTVPYKRRQTHQGAVRRNSARTENRSELYGDSSAVTSSLRAALAVASTIPDLSPKLDIDCTIAAVMASLFCDRAHDAHDAILNLRRLQRALDVARSCRLFSRMVEIELELNNPRLTLDRSSKVLKGFERIASLTRALKNPRVMDMMSTFLAKQLLRGNQWRALPAFLTNGSTLVEGSWDWSERKLAESDFFAQAGRLAAARNSAERARRAAQAIGNPRLIAAAMRGLAGASLALGFKEEASDQIEAAISVVERCEGTTEWRLTYALAAKITGDVRYSRAIAKAGYNLKNDGPFAQNGPFCIFA